MLSENRDNTFLKFVAEFVILFALLAQALAVEHDGSRRLSRACIEPRVVRRNQPRPSEDLPVPECLHRHAATARDRSFECDPAGTNKVEVISRAALAEDQLTCGEAHVGRTPDRQFQIARVDPAEERMPGQNAFQRPHYFFPSLVANQCSRLTLVHY